MEVAVMPGSDPTITLPSMQLDLSPDELLSTTRAVRKRLDLQRPVEREVLMECVELAVQAPSGSNVQRWHWLFVDDPAKKKALAEIYNSIWKGAYAATVPGTMGDTDKRVYSSAGYLADHLHEVPVMMIPLQWTRPTAGENQAGYWGSLLPAAWSFCLAARSRGLGTTFTTMHLAKEEQAAELLGIPYSRCAQGGLFPVAYTIGTDFKPAPRNDLEPIVHWNEW
jgi:nitroreductase